jgi:hypothetical protein
MLEPRCLTTLWASKAYYRDSFTLTYFYLGIPAISRGHYGPHNMEYQCDLQKN